MQTPDVVVLVPGFLGFARFGGFYYFADRLIAVLRGFLEEPLGYAVPVIPVTTFPTDSLRKRQKGLLEELEGFCNGLSGVERFHLVGHSTGGVDTQLLACTQPLYGRAWDKKASFLREKIKSVVTISAPHYGTRLADSRLARWGENPLRHPTALLPEIRTLVDLLALIPRDLAATAGIELSAPNDVLKFIWQVARSRKLIEDLKPKDMEAVRKRLAPDPAISLTCFVTGTMPRNDKVRRSDPFFRDMYRLTQGSEGVSPEVERCDHLLCELVEKHPDLVIRGDRSKMPRISPTLNDGVVNTVRQLVNPDQPHEIGGFVVADHADVLGHYDRQDALIGGKPYNAGLFHSGAAFGDDEFFKLYRRVAEAILRAIPGASPETDREQRRLETGGSRHGASRSSP
jgi:pimeloyl-ACP methyl ester carboxylesterase